MANTPSNRELGMKLLQDGNYAEGIARLLDAIEDQPSDVDLYNYLAYAYSRSGEMDKAVEVLERASDLAPASAKLHYNLGVAYQKAHNATQAKEEYLRALGMDAKYVVAKQALDSLMRAHG